MTRSQVTRNGKEGKPPGSRPASGSAGGGPDATAEPAGNPPPPANELARLDALERYQILNAESDELFDDVSRLAANLCSAPAALLSVVGANRVWYKAKIGLGAIDTARENSFCAWTILKPRLFVVTDVLKDQRFAKNGLVTAHPPIRFYAGVPLTTPDGYNLGALSVLDWRSRELRHSETKALGTLARAVTAHLELRRKNLELVRAIDDRQQALESLAVSEERYRLVVGSANDGLWDWNLENNEIHFCSRWKAMLGCEENEIGNSVDEWFKRVHSEDAERVQTDIMAHLLGHSPHFQNEHRVRRRDGSYRWMLSRGLAVWDPNRAIYRMAGSVTDITDQKEAEERLLHNAFHDVLTGLPNRALFMDRLSRSLERAKQREAYRFAVLFLDLDRFKVVNDSLGHQVGDQLLVGIARRLEASLRPGDVVARLGGDEFAIIVDRLQSAADAAEAAERIQKELAAPFNLSGHEVFASVSIGIAFNQSSEDAAEDFLRNADTAMYRAKDQGRGRVELFDKGMHARAVALLELETDLRRALLRDEFRVHYQPIVSIEDWRIAGFEALLRWEQPHRGNIPPSQFISVAEETGLILQIGMWVLRKACQQLRTWQERFPSNPPLTVSVNLSGKQFLQAELITEIRDVLAETRIAPGSLRIEITESVIIENLELAAGILKDLKELGIKISLDDFGTGYSSLSHLHRFPIDTLKIDRSFVTRMDLPKNAEIVRTIVTLAVNLGMDVIAEGVETREQIIHLTGLNCEYVQGYLLSKPVSGEAIETLIEETYRMGRGKAEGSEVLFEPIDPAKAMAARAGAPKAAAVARATGQEHDANPLPSQAIRTDGPAPDDRPSASASPSHGAGAPEHTRSAGSAKGGRWRDRRRSERFSLALPTRVTGYERNGKWTETTQTLDVSRTGVKVSLRKDVGYGMVVQLAQPLPAKLRSHSVYDPAYKAYAIVRRIEAQADGLKTVGLEFLGEQAPDGYMKKPWARYRTLRWGGPDRRREPRLDHCKPVLIEYLDDRMAPIRREEADTENVSRSGIRLRLKDRAPEFHRIRMIAPGLGLSGVAALRNRYVGSDGFERLCLQFVIGGVNST